MRIKIGIPRSLFYYKFKPFWDSFFTGLGAEIVVSGPTNKRILDNGVKNCVDEACLPVKLYFGHVLELKDKADFILVPRFMSISRNEYICPEFGGLPDVIRHSLKDLPPLLTAEVNLRRSRRGGINAAMEMAAELGVDRKKAAVAYRRALEAQRECGGTFALEEYFGKNETKEPSLRFTVAVIGHPYNIYDKHISMDLLGKLRRYGVGVVTIEMVDEREINRQAAHLRKPMFWYYGRTAYGAAMQLASSGDIDGMILVTSFGCGVDSFVNDLIERRIRKEYRIPLIIMTIDEHSGEAGFNTRLEAFIDMLQWRRTNENNVSAPG